MTIKNVLVKPTLKVTDRQWRKLMARVFEREERSSMQAAKLGLEGPKPSSGGYTESLEDMIKAEPETIERGPVDRIPPPLPGHLAGGNVRGPMAQFDLSPRPSGTPLTNPQALEYPVSESRQWRSTMAQSEDAARALAEARLYKQKTYNPLEEPIHLKSGPRSSKAKLYREKQKALAERAKLTKEAMEDEYTAPMVTRGREPPASPVVRQRESKVKATMLKPGATLPPNMQKAVEKGGHLPTAAELMTFRPPVTRKYGRLLEKTEEGDIPRNLPWAGAAKLLKKMPERFKEYKGSTPPADVLRLRQRGGSTYERRVFRPLGKEVERASSTSDYIAREQEAALKDEMKIQQGKEKRVGTAVGKITQSQKGTLAKGVDKDKLFKEALLMDTVWKNFVGGGRTLTGRAWGEYLKDEMKRGGGTRKTGIDVRDYFQTVALKWLHEPEKAAKRYPREVKSLEGIMAEVEKEHGPVFER